MYFLITLLLKATLLLTLSTLLLFIFKNASASLRHWIISLTLIGLMTLPFFTNYVPNLEVEVPFLEKRVLVQKPKKEEVTPPQTSLALADKSSFSEPFNGAVTTLDADATIHKSTTILPTFNSWQLLFSLWLIGSLISLFKLFFGIRKIHQLTLSSQPFLDSFISNHPVDILYSKEVVTPMTWGFGKGKILLPEAAKSWSKATLETVLVHELAHIQRKDYWIHILSLISACFYWFHPMVWWMKKRQILEREKACDEYVLQTGFSNNQYAEQLVKVARFLSNPSKLPTEYALPMAQISQLKQRILAILDFQKAQFRFTKIKQWQWAGGYVSLILLLAAFTPIEKSGIVKRITAELPNLERLQPLSLKTSKQEIIDIRVLRNSLLKNKENNLSNTSNFPEEAVQDDLNNPSIISTLPNISTPKVVSNKQRELPKITTPNQWQSKFGQWQENKQLFKVAIQGTFKLIDHPPYVEVSDSESMIVVEEIKKNAKTKRLVITKAPTNGQLIRKWLADYPSNYMVEISKSGVFYLWTIDGQQSLLKVKSRDKWMGRIMPKVHAKLQHENFLHLANQNDNRWLQLIKTQRELINQHSPLVSKSKSKKSSLGTWFDKGSKFRIAVYGNYRTLSNFPYVEVTDSESMLVIEEEKRGGKIIRLAISKAPYEGSMVEDFLNNKPNSWSGHYHLEENIYLWTVNEEWVFLSDKKRLKWMTRVMPTVWLKLANKSFLQTINQGDETWSSLIQSQRKLKLERFLPTEILEVTEDSPTEKKRSIDWSTIPYRKSNPIRPIGNWRKVGKTIAINTTSGSCPGNKGQKFGKFFRNMSPSVLKSFDFNMRYMDYDTVDFTLQLYQVVGGKISHKLLAEPFPAKTFTNTHRWHRIDLSREKISVEGDILVILEVDNLQDIQKGGCLLMSHGIGFYKPFQAVSTYTDWDFYDQNFAFYFSVQQ